LGLLGRGIAACPAHGFKVIAFTRNQTSHEKARAYITQVISELVPNGGLETDNSILPKQWAQPGAKILRCASAARLPERCNRFC
jgi:3-hydroxyacyl-CoA dehydrogenase